MTTIKSWQLTYAGIGIVGTCESGKLFTDISFTKFSGVFSKKIILSILIWFLAKTVAMGTNHQYGVIFAVLSYTVLRYLSA